MKLSRRSALGLGLGGLAALTLGGVGVSLSRTQARAPRAPLQALSAQQFAVLAAVADRIAPGDGRFPSAWELLVPEKIDANLAKAEPGLAVELGMGLLLLENALAAMVLDGSLTTFTRLDAAGQDATLQRWQDSPLQLRRTIYKALNGLCTATYWSSPEIWPLVGYPGPGNHLGVKELP
ncbi:gluconate 2-dehydrogenase subunit 3 family protein [Myxococcota bacterium]|nr:gluconate 2-dehydrogenase subunit 3 family protein [Myxococcota bacterium]